MNSTTSRRGRQGNPGGQTLEVAREAQRAGLAEVNLDKLEETVRLKMWNPHYFPLRRAVPDSYRSDFDLVCRW